jgi:hypothetical protein
MGNMPQDSPLPPGFSKPAEASEHPPYSHEGVQEQRGLWARFKAWFARPTPHRDSYVSDVTNPDDRRFIPRR